jgi:hypothetical protein
MPAILGSGSRLGRPLAGGIDAPVLRRSGAHDGPVRSFAECARCDEIHSGATRKKKTARHGRPVAQSVVLQRRRSEVERAGRHLEKDQRPHANARAHGRVTASLRWANAFDRRLWRPPVYGSRPCRTLPLASASL